MGNSKVEAAHVERIDSESHGTQDLIQDEVAVMGTVKLTDGQIVYIPTPTADPQGNNKLSSTMWDTQS